MLDRRRLLIGAGVGGALLVGWGLWPRRGTGPIAPAPGQTPLGPWLMVGQDSTVTVAVPQLEMGQGITTLLPQIVAAELGADWRQIGVQPAPVSVVWPNDVLAARWAELWLPFGDQAAADGWLTRDWAARHRFMATADGTSLAAYEQPARIAAAAARACLAQAAGRRWRVDWRALDVAGGLVSHAGESLTFGALAAAAAEFSSPDPPPLNPAPLAEPPVGRVPGALAAFPRLDIPAKLDGSYAFAGDIRLPGMLYAAIRHAPIGAGRLADYDTAPGRAVPGFRGCVAGEGWLAVVANTGWAAQRALVRIAPRFTVEHSADTLGIEAALDHALTAGGGTVVQAAGDAAALGAKPNFARRYDLAPALPAAIETATATAFYRPSDWFGHRLDLWVATQAPEQTRAAVAAALGMALDDVLLVPVGAGGSFDARLETPHAVEAALIAKAMGRPVQLTYSREEEHLTAIFRPPAAAALAAYVDAGGTLTGWKATIAMPASAREMGARLFDGAPRATAMGAAGGHADRLAMEGASPPYDIANLSVAHAPVAVGIPTGRLRGNGPAMMAFATESFLDEIAVALKREPLGLRMGLLGGDQRLAQCLQRVSAIAGWNGGNDGSGNGLACARLGDPAGNPLGGGCIAAIATARRGDSAGGAGGVRVDRLFAVADLGRIVNVDIALQQIEGGLIFGLGLALGCTTAFAQGLPQTTRLRDLALPTLGDCPQVQVELLASDAPAFDPGELGVVVVAPAVANALASATGLRFRKLPLVPEED